MSRKLGLTRILGVAMLSCVTLLPLSYDATAYDGPYEVTLREALATGVYTNPEYGIVASSRRATDEELRQAKALYYPSIDFSADTGFEHSDDPGTRAGTDGDDEEDLWRYDAGLTVTQTLFDGWDSKYEIERQKNRVASSAHRVREAAELVGFSIVDAYLENLKQRRLLDIATLNVEDHLYIMNQINEGVAAGRLSQADLEQARARLASAKAAEADARQNLRRAEATYIRNVGELPSNLVRPGVPLEYLSVNVEEEVNSALAFSPTLDIYESDIEVADSEFNKTQSTMYPELDLQLNARQGEDLGGVEGRDTSASALVVMNWNLYRGGADTARAREHIHRKLQAKERRDQEARKLENEVRATWALMETSGDRARQYADQSAANIEVVKAYRDQFMLDRRTLLDVLDAQNELFVSRSNLVNAEFTEMQSVYKLLALKGQLLPSMNVAYPGESIIE